MTTTEILTGIKNWVVGKLTLKQDVINDLASIRSGAQAGSTSVQPADILSYFDNAAYDSGTHRINFYHGQSVIAYVDASPFIIDGMVNDVRIENGYLVIDFNTDSGKQDISIPLTDIFNPNNYYTKSETDSRLTQKQSEIDDLYARIGYYVCPTEGNVAAKTIVANNYTLGNGGSIKIKMTNANTVNNATLNINSTGAKALYYDGERASANNSWEAGETVEVYYDGTSFYANNVAGGSGSGDGAFDVSVKYPTSGVDGGNTYTLEGALAVLNANLSASKKKGGMSIKFIHSFDNKYVQHRYMLEYANTGANNAAFANVANWQGVDDTISESNNLVTGNAIYLQGLKVLKLKKIVSSGFGGGCQVGDFVFQTNNNALRKVLSIDEETGSVTSSKLYTPAPGSLYTCDNVLWQYNGTQILSLVTNTNGMLTIGGSESGIVNPFFFNVTSYTQVKGGTGIFDSVMSAVAAIPSSYRRNGLVITFCKESSNPPKWESYRFVGPNTTDGYWNVETRWVKIKTSITRHVADGQKIATLMVDGVGTDIYGGLPINYLTLSAYELQQGYYSTRGIYISSDSSSTKRVCTIDKYPIPYDGKIQIKEASGSSLPFVCRISLYSADGTFVKFYDINNDTPVDTSEDVGVKYFTFSFINSNSGQSITPADASDVFAITVDATKLSAETKHELKVTADICNNQILYVVPKSGLSQGIYNESGELRPNEHRCSSHIFYTVPLSGYINILRIDNTLNNYFRIVLYDKDKNFVGQKTYQGVTFPINISDIETTGVPVYYHWTYFPSNPNTDIVTPDMLAGKVACSCNPAFDFEIESLRTRTTLLETNYVPKDFVDEETKICNDALKYDCDFRMLVFTDPHSFAEDKYSKYNNILKKGVADILLGLGDYNIYANVERNQLKCDIKKCLALAGNNENAIFVVGNHEYMANFDWDHNNYPYDEVQPEVSTDYVFENREMFSMLTNHLSHIANFNEDAPYGNYYYIDYEPQKIRLIVLNTSDIYEDDGSLEYLYDQFMMIHQEQASWFVNKALDFTDKGTDKSNWGVIVSCHYSNYFNFITSALDAFKRGATLSSTQDFYRRCKYDELTHRYTSDMLTEAEGGKYTITISKDFSAQGAMDVICVLQGHSHLDVDFLGNGIRVIQFVCDNGHLNDLYRTEVEGLTAGEYRFQSVRGSTFHLTLTDDLSNAKYIDYNKYFDTPNSVRTEVIILDEDLTPIYTQPSVPRDDEYTGGTLITGFTQIQTTPVSNEKCELVCIDRTERTIKCFPFGTAYYREISY